ncbi:MAG: glycosyltransferase family 4 protein [Candidatus Omnitrophica bacterium]|nr:glycosyltransferase family 4 protein [Candidatus Omnitrophota bacterium]
MTVTKKLKIVHIIPFYYPVIGGMEELVKNIAETLAEKGHDIDIFTTDRDHEGKIVNSPRKERINSVNVYRFRTFFKFGFMSFFPGIIWSLLRKKYNIIHLHSYRHPHTEIASFIGAIKSVPTILHGHGPFYSDTISKWKFICYSAYDFIARYSILKRISMIVASTEIEKKEYIKRGVSEHKIKVLPNGLRNIYFSNVNTAEVLKQYALLGKKTILYVGRLHPNKRIDALISSLPQIIKHEPRAYLLLIGPGADYYPYLNMLAHKNKVEKHFKWLGAVSELEKIMLYNAADCFVMPSDYEPFGLVLLEAMAAKKPVIAIKAGGPTEIVEDGQTGFLIERNNTKQLENTILMLLQNPDLANKIGSNARLRAEEFRLSKMVDRIEAIYYDLVKKL